MRAQRVILLAMPAALALVAAYSAQPQAKSGDSSAPSSGDKPKERMVTIEFTGQWKHNDATGEGSANGLTLQDSDTIVKADKATYNDKQKIAHATGHMTLSDPQADGTADKADIQYAKSKKIVDLDGDVVITVKPKSAEKDQRKAAPAPAGPATVAFQDGKAEVQPAPSASDDDKDSPRKYPVKITCDHVKYEYSRDKRHAVLTGHFKAVQELPDKVRTLTADHAEWFGADDKVILFKPVHFEDTKGTRGDPNGEVTISTKEGDESLSTDDKGGKIILHVDDEDQDSSKPAPAKKPEPAKPEAKPTPKQNPPTKPANGNIVRTP